MSSVKVPLSLWNSAESDEIYLVLSHIFAIVNIDQTDGQEMLYFGRVNCLKNGFIGNGSIDPK